MKRYLRWGAAAGAVLCGLVLIGALLVRFLLPLDRIRAMAVEGAAGRLGREVRVAGISAGLRGAELRGIEVSEAPDFKAGTAFRAERLVVGVRWLPLILKRNVLVDDILLSDWEADVVRAKAAAKEEPAQAGRTQGPDRAPGIGSLRLENGRVRYLDEASGLKAELAEVRLRAKGIRLDSPFPLSASASFVVRQGPRRHEGRFELEGRFDPASGDLKRMALDLDPLKLKLGGLSLEAEGRVADFVEPGVDLAVKTRSALGALGAVNPALAFVPMPALEGRLKLKKSADELRIEEARVKGQGLSLSVTGRVRKLSSPKPDPDLSASLTAELPELSSKLIKAFLASAPDLSLPPPKIDVKARWKNDVLTLSPARVALGPVELRADGRIAFPSGPARLALSVETNSFKAEELARLAPALAAYRPSGRARVAVRADGALPSPALEASVALSSFAVTLGSHSFSSVEGEVKASSGLVTARLRGGWNGADFQAEGSGKGFLPPKLPEPEVWLEGRLSRLDFAHLAPQGPSKDGGGGGGAAAAPPKTYRVSGKLLADALQGTNFEAGPSEASWDLRGVGDASRLTGFLKLRVGPGKFEDIKSLAEGKPMLRLALMPVLILQKVASLAKVPFLPSFDRVTFKEMTADYALQSGVMSIRESHMDSSAGFVTASGTADLGRNALALRLDTKLAEQGPLRLSGPVGFTVTGTPAEPVVKVDPVSLLKQPEVEKAVDNVRKAVEEGGKRLLENLLKR
ncbi:MAG TPA: hypothetical protein DCM05_07770 [Elusimicrobia bacterium]|nr:hypothetical protein [Elusimicrobiota bacterium]